MAVAVVDSFKQLPSSRARMEAVSAIVDQLTPYEWRDLRDKLNSRTFHHDVVGSLPLELVVAVFSYLDPADSFRYQLVCRRWRTVLSSQDVLRASLALWYPNEDFVQQDGKARSESDKLAFIYLKMECMQRLRLARPSSQQIYRVASDDDAFGLSTIEDREYAFCRETVAWMDPVPQKRSNLHTRNLRTGQTHVFNGRSREQMKQLILTDQLVASLAFTGECYAWDLLTKERRSFRCPSSQVRAINGSDRTLAALVDEETSCTVILWNFDDQATHCVVIQSRHCVLEDSQTSCEVRPEGILLNSTRRTLTVFYLDRKFTVPYLDSTTVEKRNVHSITYNFSGEAIKSDTMSMPGIQNKGVRSVNPIDDNGRFVVIFNNTPPQPRDYLRPAGVVYDERRNKFSECPYIDHLTACWKDTVYINHHSRFYALPVDQAQKYAYQLPFLFSKLPIPETLLVQRLTGLIRLPRNLRSRRSTPPSNRCIKVSIPHAVFFHPLLGNDTYMVSFDVRRLAVWCFDPRIKLPPSDV